MQLSASWRYRDGRTEPAAGVTFTSPTGSVLQVEGDTATALADGIGSVIAQRGDHRAFALVRAGASPGVSGLLRRDPAVRRYFVNDRGEAVFLTGAHVWINLVDIAVDGRLDPFDYVGYLDDLAARGHNFVRLWAWEQARWFAERPGNVSVGPLPYKRAGPETAVDGLPRFDLAQLNPAYFQRLRERVQLARERGLYVAVMLFNGWSVGPNGDGHENPWRGHPFNAKNNINGIDGDPKRTGRGTRVHRLEDPSIVRYQEAYVRAVAIAVGDLDNVLYEVSNESLAPSMEWQRHWIKYLREMQGAGLILRQPVGVSAERPGESNDDLLASNADWIAPFRVHPRPLDPMPWHGAEVMINDTDHLCGVCGSVPWAWRSLTRGQNTALMDAYNRTNAELGHVLPWLTETDWPAVRRAMGWTRVVASWLDLRGAQPFGGLSSSGYLLGRPGKGPERWVLYLDSKPSARLMGELTRGRYRQSWINAETGELRAGGELEVRGERDFHAPAKGDFVLLLERIGD